MHFALLHFQCSSGCWWRKRKNRPTFIVPSTANNIPFVHPILKPTCFLRKNIHVRYVNSLVVKNHWWTQTSHTDTPLAFTGDQHRLVVHRAGAQAFVALGLCKFLACSLMLPDTVAFLEVEVEHFPGNFNWPRTNKICIPHSARTIIPFFRWVLLCVMKRLLQLPYFYNRGIN